jgi:hypothetical protein
MSLVESRRVCGKRQLDLGTKLTGDKKVRTPSRMKDLYFHADTSMDAPLACAQNLNAPDTTPAKPVSPLYHAVGYSLGMHSVDYNAASR